ncbi:class I SAM-dependent methyltransferase [Amycolatopsis sp. NPDC059027]|uniref:class I SAM-dependent methyltransferase n=1 Tax=unclassified Amycolatopsis TaxID=2618356 RepID=UPI003671899B
MSEENYVNAEFWDGRYREQDSLWSGATNGTLVAEVAGLTPGQALDVGCGEGADARWLAEKGWRVTAIDVSQVALERAAAHGGENVAWVRTDLAVSSPPAASFDLVSAHYFPIRKESAVRGLLAAVAPGGTLLFVGHDFDGALEHHEHNGGQGPDPRDFYQPSEVAALLDDDWKILVHETRERAHVPEGNPHHRDTVLRAQRLR